MTELKKLVDALKYAQRMSLENVVIYREDINLILDTFSHLQDEKQNLEIKLKVMRAAANSYKAANEGLKNDIVRLNSRVELERETTTNLTIKYNKLLHQLDCSRLLHQLGNAKDEAYIECIKKAKKELAPFVVNVPEMCVVLNNLLKELLGKNTPETNDVSA